MQSSPMMRIRSPSPLLMNLSLGVSRVLLYSFEDECGCSLAVDYNKDTSVNKLSWAFSHSIGKAAGSDNIWYPFLRKLLLIGCLTLLDTVNWVW